MSRVAFSSRLWVVVGLCAAVVGCANAQASSPPKKSATSASAAKKSADNAAAKPHAAREPSDRKFMVPFSWEAKQDDPLARTRTFMSQLFTDNRAYTREHGAAFFSKLAEGEHPRAALVTCSDSRIQSTAFDRSPEDDVFTVRNLGNQLASSRGTVEYGVHELHASVLLIMGHTRCGAVRAAMGDLGKERESVRLELEHLNVPKYKGDGKAEEDTEAWLAAVEDNVHDQVGFALGQFAEEVEQANLTVIGAVYDLADDKRGGAGTVHVINVNGHKDPERVAAFTRAVQGLPALAAVKHDDHDHAAPRAGGKLQAKAAPLTGREPGARSAAVPRQLPSELQRLSQLKARSAAKH